MSQTVVKIRVHSLRNGSNSLVQVFTEINRFWLVTLDLLVTHFLIGQKLWSRYRHALTIKTTAVWFRALIGRGRLIDLHFEYSCWLFLFNSISRLITYLMVFVLSRAILRGVLGRIPPRLLMQFWMTAGTKSLQTSPNSCNIQRSLASQPPACWRRTFCKKPTKNHWNRATLAAWKARSNLKVRPEFGFKTYAGHFGIKIQTIFRN